MRSSGARAVAAQLRELVGAQRQLHLPAGERRRTPVLPSNVIDGARAATWESATPGFTLIDGRYVPAADVHAALAAGQRIILLEQHHGAREPRWVALEAPTSWNALRRRSICRSETNVTVSTMAAGEKWLRFFGQGAV
jgi:hypothetical protein